MREGGKGLRRLGFAALFMLAASAATAQTQELAIGQRNLACGSPTSLNDGWPTATPESVGLDGSRLCGIAAKLAATNANVHAVVIARHGRLVFEQYFNGQDELWGTDRGPHEFDATTKHDMRSVSKSVTSLLVGIAIDRELIKGVDEPILKFFPDYAAVKTAGWDKVTLRHLLTMTSGMQNGTRTAPGPICKMTNGNSASMPTRSGMSCRSQSRRLRTLSGTTTAVEQTCSATSSNVCPASRLRRSRAKRCSRRSASRTGNG